MEQSNGGGNAAFEIQLQLFRLQESLIWMANKIWTAFYIHPATVYSLRDITFHVDCFWSQRNSLYWPFLLRPQTVSQTQIRSSHFVVTSPRNKRNRARKSVHRREHEECAWILWRLAKCCHEVAAFVSLSFLFFFVGNVNRKRFLR